MPEITRPTEGDVVAVITDDHRWFEDALRELRDVTTPDRDRVLHDLSAVLIAHAEAEETHVYPQLRRSDAIDNHEVQHSEGEHREINEALLELLRVARTDGVDGDEASHAEHELSEVLSHHLDEEERDVLNPARTDVDDAERSRLGLAFLAERNRLLDTDCGSEDNVARIVNRGIR